MRYKYYVKKKRKETDVFLYHGEAWAMNQQDYMYMLLCSKHPLSACGQQQFFSTNIHNTLFPVCSVSDHHHTVSYRHTFIIRRRTDMKNRFFFLKIWLFLCFTFIFNIFYVSTINRKFTSMDAGSWRTSRWRPFYSSVPRSTYSSFTDVLKSRVNTYLINT